MLLTAGLFISVFILVFLLTVPTDEYETSPLNIVLDTVNRRIEEKLTEGDKGERLSAMGRSPEEVIKISLTVGAGLALVGGFLSFKFLKILALAIAAVLFIAGIWITQLVVENEFKRWQSKILSGIPTLLNFVPAFLEVGSVTPREALSLTLPFLSNPLAEELWSVVDTISRTGRVQEAFDRLARRVKHPLVDAVCFRLSSTWDTKMTPDIFSDLSDQVDALREEEANRATAAKSGLLVVVSLLGLIGAGLVFFYPGFQFMAAKLSSGFGF